MLRHDPDNLFEDDLAEFLDSFDDKDSSSFIDVYREKKIETSSEDEMEDLASFFEDNFEDLDDNSTEVNLFSSLADSSSDEEITSVPLPSDQEIQEIFSEDHEGEKDNHSGVILSTNEIIDVEDNLINAHTLNLSEPNEDDQAILSLFTENLTDEDINYPETLKQKQDPFFFEPEESEPENPWDELEQLLADDNRSSSLSVEIPPILKVPIENKADNSLPDFYESLEELDHLLEIPATHLATELNSRVDIEQLEAIINAPCGTEIDQLSKTSVSGKVEPRSGLSKDSEIIDDLDKEINELFRKTVNQSIGSKPAVSQKKPAKQKSIEQTMRVPIKQLDNLSNLIGELVVKRNRLEQDQERLRLFLDNLLNQVQQLSDVGGRMQDLYERTLLEGALLASRNRARQDNQTKSLNSNTSTSEGNSLFDQDLDALEMDRFTDFHLLSQEMIELIVRVRESASDIQFIVDETDQVARSLRQVSTQLQEGMTKSRMVPFAQSADHLPRAIRDISVKLNKQAKLQVEGRDVLIDKMIVEHLSSPMIHLVNNAMTHGIESPEERIQKGKPPEGRILVRAFIQGNQTVISISDDGAGIDVNRVKRKAIEKELITREEANILTEQEVYDFLFHPGFSTKDKADDFAGRGVGLDVVRKEMIEVRGTVTIDSALGKGTTFTIRLPLTLSISKALCCLSNHFRIAFPMDGVEDMKDFLPGEIKTNAQGEPCIPWYEGTIPFQPLNKLLTFNRYLSRGNVYGGRQEEDTVSIVILRSGGNFLAVQVDQVLGEQEIVIKQIEGPIPKPIGIAGATVLGDGTVMPIGDVLELIEIAQGKIKPDGSGSPWHKVAMAMQIPLEAKTEPTVLIVDDSITVREILSLSFSKSGYRVEQARDGQEAWEKLRSGLPCDIVFCDIEMPRMNGLELLSNIQKDEKLAHLPVAVLSSRGAEKHRKVAAKLGASGYFTKPYTEKDLLDAAKRMIAGDVLLAGSIRPKRKPKVATKTIPPTPIGQTQSKNPRLTVPGTSLPPSNYRVLIIDDSVMVREMLSMTFGKVGYEIEQARDGQEAWEKLRSGLTCDLILCDIEMPRMNGLELLSRLQEDAKLSAIPIAMITSRGAQKMQNIAAERGAKGYFVKPYIDSVLLDSAKRLIAGEVLLERDSKVEG
ncbi:hybrid sensor histidine kinase/response regulator [Gloeothece verrucosa]|uniref:histidine kinase n=1 Tax=Gloeothece verrucosa (strain PCC 7822) TaxID=497965 RepID=E0UHV4_GLOV7|nr:hybrid sensor histidine kinase/response regulator [Gloeothece verrucosa]ADN14484.1 putative CheA signal transduction histidine kinase [Gloeothece verrucosa PCC 7822]